MKPVILFVLIGTLLCTCNSACRKKTDTPPVKDTKNQRILSQAIVFKTAAHIQEKYLDKYRNQKNDEIIKFYRILDATVLSRSTVTQSAQDVFPGDSAVSQCAARIRASDKSCRSVKKILDDFDIPGHIVKDGDVVFNPYIFMPRLEIVEGRMEQLGIDNLWELLYTAILLDDPALIKQVHPILVKRVTAEWPDDREFLHLLQNLYRIQNDKNKQECDVASLGIYYLITGSIAPRLHLNNKLSRKTGEVMAVYDRDYYDSSYIAINTFTRENRRFMWLAARRREQAGDINKANVYLRSTFHSDVLRNVRKFHPNHQVFLYATMRIALKLHSPQMYQFVYRGLDPLTKFNDNKYKEFLKVQLLQLMD